MINTIKENFNRALFALIFSIITIGTLSFLSFETPYGLFLAGSFGSSMVLLFGYPESPFAQPKNVFFGHFVTSLVGVLILYFLPVDQFLQIAIAVGLGIFLMILLGVTHPPAGGKSQRFGQDKSQVKLNGKILIDYILSEIIDEFKETLIVTNQSISFMSSKKITVIEDFKKGLGPLGGVLSAMKWIKDNNKEYSWISTFPADTPFFTKKELKSFYNDIKIKNNKLFFIKDKNTRHNIFGLWSLDLMDQLETDLYNGERKVEIWANSIGVSTVNIEYKNINPFFNINTIDDLEKAKKIKNDD